jgi:tungstate transport system ATP-binding protein
MVDGATNRIDSANPGSESLDLRGVLPVELKSVRVARQGRTLIDGVDLTLDAGPLTVVMGANGAGKSLLLRLMANLVTPDSGQVLWAGARPNRECALRLGMVFQKPVMLRRSVVANLEFALGMIKVPRRERRDRAMVLLEGAGMGALAETSARVLSGGEQQRLALLRALATRPQLIALDEPTASLDPRATLDFETLVDSARATGTKVVLVTHDRGQASRLADEVVFLHHGQVVEQAPAQRFFSLPEHDAAKAFLDGRLYV